MTAHRLRSPALIGCLLLVCLLPGCGGRVPAQPVAQPSGALPADPPTGPAASPAAPSLPTASRTTAVVTPAVQPTAVSSPPQAARRSTSSPAAPSPDPGTGARWLPHWTSDGVPAAQLSGVEVTTDEQQDCVWLQAEDGSRIAALWPPRYRVRFQPLRVSDEDDRLVWQEGTERTVGGGYSPVFVDRLPERCRTGEHAWWVAPLDS